MNSSYTDPHHDDFFVHPQATAIYKNWVKTLLTRVNTLTGVAYKDEPAIAAWELANEPRCQGSGHYGTSNECVKDYAVYNTTPVAVRITAWVTEMSAFIKSIDARHLVAVGDEGFLCEEYQTCGDTTCDCYYGTDYPAFTALPTIDFGSAHLYPDAWGKDIAWGTQWILNHTQGAAALGKPFLLGEFGSKAGASDAQHDVCVQGRDGQGLASAPLLTLKPPPASHPQVC